MSGEDKQSTTQFQSSQTSPWAPAQGPLLNLLSKYGGMSTDMTGAQKSAFDQLMASSQNIPGFGDQGSEALSTMFSTDTAPQVGMLTDAYKNLQKNMGGVASGAQLDPYSTPGFSEAMDRMSGDITNRVKSTYAAAGRDPSGAGSFAGSLGKGLTDGLAPMLMQQYNTNAGRMDAANNTLFGAGGTTASGITGQQQVPISNAAQALGLIPAMTGAYTAPAQAQVGAANAQYAQPFANMGMLLNPLAGIAGLGSQSQGTGTSETVQKQSTMGNIMGGISSAVGLGSMLFSDARLKDDIERVGKLDDGQPIYRYRMKGSDVPQIGLMAQDVAEEVPDAIGEFGGMLMVDYGRATDRAAQMARAA